MSVETLFPILSPSPPPAPVLTKEPPRSGCFGLGKSLLLSASFLSSVNQDEADDEPNSTDDENLESVSLPSYDYVLPKDELEKIKVEMIDGDKPGSKWLVLDDVHILYKYGYEGKEETFWECYERRRNKCRFKAATIAGDDSINPTLSYAYKFETHDCDQTKVGPIMQKFRTKIKKRMQTEYKNKFRKIFDDEKKALLKDFRDNQDMLETILYQLKDRRSYRNMANRARERNYPRNPRNHQEIDFSLIGMDNLQLGRCAHPDPEIKDKDVFLFGTPLNAEAFAKAEFKSGDGTFKICPKLFYQMFVLMARYGGIYVPCLFGLLPDKSEDSYLRFFGMLWAYNDKNDLPNDFQHQFFMCDFEQQIRTSFLLYWPYVRVLDC